MRPKPQPTSPLMTYSLQKKVQFPSKPAPFRKHFSVHITRKGVSFFGNAWALPPSRAFDIPINRGGLHILSAHLMSEMQRGTEITALAPTQTCVFIQHNSTLPRDANSGPESTQWVHITRPAPLKAFLLFSKAYIAQVQWHRSAQHLFLGLSNGS